MESGDWVTSMTHYHLSSQGSRRLGALLVLFAFMLAPLQISQLPSLRSNDARADEYSGEEGYSEAAATSPSSGNRVVRTKLDDDPSAVSPEPARLVTRRPASAPKAASTPPKTLLPVEVKAAMASYALAAIGGMSSSAQVRAMNANAALLAANKRNSLLSPMMPSPSTFRSSYADEKSLVGSTPISAAIADAVNAALGPAASRNIGSVGASGLSKITDSDLNAFAAQIQSMDLGFSSSGEVVH